MRHHRLLSTGLATVALLAAAAAPARAASVAELLQQVDQQLKPDEIAEPGSTVRAKAIGALVGEELGLSPAELLELRLAEAEAWLDAGRIDEVESRLSAVLRAAPITPALRERAGLAWVAAWQLQWRKAEKPGEVAEVAAELKPFGDLGNRVAARAHTAEARRQLALKHGDGVFEHFDQALALLKDAKPAERVPVYSLRMLAMEELGKKPEEVQAWMQARIADPAAAEVLDSAMTDSQKLVGQPAPALKLKRLDGTPGEIDLTAYRGKFVMIDFFATWCKPCEGVAPMISAVAARLGAKGLVTIGVSLDTKDTLPSLPGWIAKHGITYPIIGEGLGWDGETDKAWHIDAIPALLLIGPDGRIASNELLAASADETLRNIEGALNPVPAGPPGAPPAGAPPAKPDAPGFVP
jgi:thiol-disulfide isomerase/thioredoxin